MQAEQRDSRAKGATLLREAEELTQEQALALAAMLLAAAVQASHPDFVHVTRAA